MRLFREIIENLDFESVWEKLTRDYEGIHEYKDSYESIFRRLKTAEPLDGVQMRIRVEKSSDGWFSDPEDESLQVTGWLPGDDEGYAIGVRPVAEIVACPVEDTELEDSELCALVLAEISWCSTSASAAWGRESEMAIGGLLSAESCIEDENAGRSLKELRSELGLGVKGTGNAFYDLLNR